MSTALNTLKNRNFGIYTAGNTVSLIGMWAQRIAVGVLIWELTGSAAWLGTVAVAEFVPIFFLSPLGGVLADRYDRRRILITCLSVSLLQALLLCLLTAFDLITPELVVLLSAVAGTVFALNTTARLTLVPMMLPRDLLSSAIAITSVIFNLARFIGPFLGGLIIAQFGIAFAFGFNAVSFITILVALAMLELPAFEPKPKKDGHPILHMLEEFVEGCRYTFTHPSIAVLMLMVLSGAIFSRPIVELIPGIVDTLFRSDLTEINQLFGWEIFRAEDALPNKVAIFTSAMGIGAVMAGLILANKSSVKNMTWIMIASVLANSVCVILLVLSANFWLATLLVAIAGFVQVASGTGSQTIVQHIVEEEMRGRVLSLWSVGLRGGPGLGALVMGIAADYYGLGLPLMIGGVLTIMTTVVLTRFRESLETQVNASSH